MRRWAIGASVFLALAALLILSTPLITGLSFVVRSAGMGGSVHRLADLATSPVTEHMDSIPTGSAPLRARRYEPETGGRRKVLLVSGLHPAGIDEPRLVGLARQLAASGLTVTTPDIRELSQFQITPAVTDAIERSAQWLLAGASGETDGRIGLIGISFGGGLSLVAAGRPSVRDRLTFVLSFGGYDDLPRVLRYLCTGREPAPRPGAPDITRPPHDYGVAVVLLAIADTMVPPDQVEPLRRGVRQFLMASALDPVDKPEALRQFAAVKALAGALPEPSATLLRYVDDRGVARLGERLVDHLAAYGTEPALSLSKSPKPSAPAFLLHGTDDNVIPAAESEFLAADLAGSAPVRLLLSPVILHAEAGGQAHAADVWALGSFWADVLRR
jgi:dienelactone hydrolase